MRDETLFAIKYQLRADPTVSQAEIPKLLGRLREGPQPSAPASPWLGIMAAARYAATSRWTIGRWIKDGRLKAGRVGGVTRIRRADLDALFSGEAI